jgi:membrane protein implicated in regulation of membrane protease activity
MNPVVEWWQSLGRDGLFALVEAITPLWWMIAAVAGFGLGFFTSGRVDFGSTLAIGCFVAGVADLLGASAAAQLALIPATSIALCTVFVWRLWANRTPDSKTAALVPADVVGCAGVVLSVDPSDASRLRVQLDGRHVWPARCADGIHLTPGARVRVRSREQGVLVVVADTEPRK